MEYKYLKFLLLHVKIYYIDRYIQTLIRQILMSFHTIHMKVCGDICQKTFIVVC